ncbi:hypothetical protein [Burkholderia ubonensis]|uniref:hypothetical protein n=1 Tax=Burkholderia ubonensis TaxID=101571 RepID=UPI000A6B457A|nr:hypothetical protein [Burkholderia ubonensis]
MPYQLINVLSAIRTLCLTLQQNPAGAGSLLALAALALAAYALVVVSRHGERGVRRQK